MVISAYNSSTIGTLFSSLNGTSSSDTTGMSGLYSSLSDYASIKSGNYYQLMKAYYAEVVDSDSDSDSSSSSSKVTTSTSTSQDSTSKIASIESAADGMTDAASALLKSGSSSAFAKTSTTDADGHVTSSYDTDKIYKNVSAFVDAYNTLLSQSGTSKDSSISSASKALVSMTEENEKLLGSVGITIGEDNKLSIDETTFKNADMSVAKSLFNGAGSYGYQVSAKASMIDYYAQSEALKASTYTSSGTYTYNYSTGEIYNTTT